MKVLGVSYGAGHIRTLLPVLVELESMGHDVTVLALTTAGVEARRAGLKTIGFTDLVEEGDGEALSWGRKLSGGQISHPDISQEETVAYMGLSYGDLIMRLGKEEAAERFASKGRQAFLPLGPLGRAFDRLEPDLVMTTSSPRAERAANIVARQRKVRSIVLPDLYPWYEMEWLSEPGYGTRICVIAERVKRQILAAGRSDEEVVVTGSAAFDDLADPKGPELGRAWRESKGIGPDDRMVLFASQPHPDPTLGSRLACELAEQAMLDPSWKLVVRPHPNEKFLFETISENVICSYPHEPLIDLLYGTDATIVHWSTVGLQAALVGQPIVVWQIPVHPNPATFEKIGLGDVVTSAAEVWECLRHVKFEAGNREIVGELGGATRRIADVCEGLLEG